MTRRALRTVVVALLITACGSASVDVSTIEPLEETTPGEVRTLLEAAERPVVLNVWASWCAPCRSEAPLLRSAVDEFGDRVQFIGIDVRDSQDGARGFIAEFGLDGFTHLFDPTGSVPDELGGFGVPLTFFFAPGGELQTLHAGVIDERSLALEIDELLATSLMEFSLLGAALVAVLAAYAVLRFEAGRTNAADCTRDVWDALVTGVVVGLVVGRVAAMIGAGTNPITNPADLLIVRGGVDTIAAGVAGIATYGWMVRADLWRLADAGAPAAVGGLAGWHAGCTVRDACLGTTTDLPWALAGPGGLGRHPVELYAALLLGVLVIGLVVWKGRSRLPGLVAATAITGAAAVRAVTEPLRPGLGGDLAIWYWSAVVVAGGLALVLARRDGDEV